MRNSKNHDIINKPSHYNQGSIEPIDFIKSQNMSYIEGNIINVTFETTFLQ